MPTNYYLDIVILLAAAVVAVPLFRAIGLGVVPGFLVAGVAVGPSGLALIDNVTEIGQLSELGVVLLLFVIGIELKPSRLWLMRRLVLGLGTLQVVLTGILITAAVYLLLDVAFPAAAVIGPALALSSTAFVVQLLAEQRSLHSEYGRASLAVLLLQDVAVVPLLALVPLLTMRPLSIGTDIAIALAETVVILLAVIVGGRYLLQPILHRVARARSKEVFTAVTVLLVLSSALLTEHLGLSMAMGAFIAGLLIANSPFLFRFVYNPGFQQSRSGWIASALGGAILLCCAIFLPSVNRFLSSRFLRYGGRISYSFYLLHFPIMILSSRAITAPVSWLEGLVYLVSVFILTFLGAAVSFRFVERPSIRLGNALCRGLARRTESEAQFSRLAA